VEGAAKLPSASLDTTLDAGDCGAGPGRNRRHRFGGGEKRPVVRALGSKAALQAEKRRPLKKGTKMLDKRTMEGKAMVATLQNNSARDFAARAALARFATNKSTSIEEPPKNDEAVELLDSDVSEAEEDEDAPQEHPRVCGCRACSWDKMLCGEIASTIRNWN
jgi:hypothetical protein